MRETTGKPEERPGAFGSSGDRAPQKSENGGPVGIRTPVFGFEGQKDNPGYPTGPLDCLAMMHTVHKVAVGREEDGGIAPLSHRAFLCQHRSEAIPLAF